MTPQDDSEAERHAKASKEANWQLVAAPLFCVREIREAVIFSVLTSDDATETDHQLVRDVTQLESRLLRNCLREDYRRTVTELNLDHVESWQEIVDYLRTAGEVGTAAEIYSFMVAVRRIIEKFRVELD